MLASHLCDPRRGWPKIIRSDWLSLRSKLLIKERDAAKQKYHKHKREEDKRIYNILQEKVDKQCKDDQVKFYQKMCDNLTKAAPFGGSRERDASKLAKY